MLCSVNKQLQPFHEVWRQIGVIRIQTIRTCARFQCCFQTIQPLHKLLVGLRSIAAPKLLLAGKVDRGQEGNHGSFQHIRNMLYHILVVRMQYPVRQIVYVLSQTLPVLLDGVGIVPAVPVPFQLLLVLDPLLFLNNLAGLLQHLIQHMLVLDGEDFRLCLFDLAIHDLHPVPGLLSCCPVHLSAKLLLFVLFAQFFSFRLQVFQFRQALLENTQGISFGSR